MNRYDADILRTNGTSAFLAAGAALLALLATAPTVGAAEHLIGRPRAIDDAGSWPRVHGRL